MSSLTQTTLNDFDILKTIGQGSFSKVYLVKRKLDSKIYALKSVFIEKLPKNQQDNSVNEVRILASVHHQNVISYKEAFWDDKTSSLNIVMEYAEDGDLYTKIKKMKENKFFFEEKKIWDYTIQIIQGLKALHDKNIMHRDLKSENIFLTKKNSQCKIGDMNVSKVLKEKLLRTQTGTPYYASPEVWMNKPYSFKSDLWSIGCVIYEMCELKTPFNGKDMDDLFVTICLNKVKRINDIYSDDLWFMINKLLEVNVDKRFDCKQFLECDIVQKKINELKNFNNNFEEKHEKDNSLLLNTIYFRNIKDIKKQLPHQKFYNDESTTESNSKKKEKENIINNKSNENIMLIKNLKKELESLKQNQELRKKEKEINANVNDVNNINNANKKTIINQKIKQLNIKLKNIQFKNKLEINKIKKYKISIPNNYNNKNIKFIKRPQLKDLSNNNSAYIINTNFSKFNNSLESIDSYYNIHKNKNKNYISHRNINLDNFVYKKIQNNSFNRSISYHMDDNKKIPMVIINTNNININHNIKKHKSINGKLFNKLRFLNLNTSIGKDENININKLKNGKINNKYQININFNFMPNNYQRYIKDNTNNNSRYSLENINSKSNIDLSINNIKKNRHIYYKKSFNTKPSSLIKANSHKKILDINIDSNLRKIKSILSCNSNSKIEFKGIKNNSALINNTNLSKHKSLSERIKKFNLLKIPKKKLISKKHLLMNKIPKCIISNTNRNIINIPLSLNQLKTSNNIKEKIYMNRNYLI